MKAPGPRLSRRPPGNAHVSGGAAWPPYPPYPPFPPFPPYPAYPPYPPCAPQPTPCTDTLAGDHSGDSSEDGVPQAEDETATPLRFPAQIEVRRPDDLLVCTLTFNGLAFSEGPARLERAAAEAFITVTFPPQSFGEEAFLQTAQQSDGATVQPLEVTTDAHYPKQNVAGTDDRIPLTLPLARIRMAGASRIVVAMPREVSAVAFDLPSVLAALRDWPMQLAPGAVPEPSSLAISAVVVPVGLADGAVPPAPPPPALRLPPQRPAAHVTALELPYRVFSSPLAPARWRHSPWPVVHQGRTELWHTRLTGSDAPTGPESPSRFRAIWSEDYRPLTRLSELYALMSLPGPPPPRRNPALIRMPLDPVDRAMLVTLMAGFDATRANGRAYVPQGSEAKRLHLSALGALLEAEGSWDTRPQGIDLQQWRHQATLGRDHQVRVVYAGWLCPFRHQASLVKVTERQFQSINGFGSARVAVLRQRFFVVVRQPRMAYTGAGHTHHGHDFPFTQVEVLTRATPDLVEPGFGLSALAASATAGDPYQAASIAPRMLFWPMTVGSGAAQMTDVRFDLAATDLLGNRVTFSMPLLFVGEPANQNPLAIAALKAAYNAAAVRPKRRASLGGSPVAYAPVGEGNAGDTRLSTEDITFQAGNTNASAEPAFYPEIERATVAINAVQKLLGKPGFVSEVAYPDVYAQKGFDAGANAGQVFLQLTSALPLSFGGKPSDAKSDALGALASPQMNLLGLSRLAGPVAGQAVIGVDDVRQALTNAVNSKFDPKDFFGDATLLGGITLSDIVQASASLAGGEVPKMLTTQLPDYAEARFDWESVISVSDGRNLIIPRADPGGPETRLTMSGLVRTPLNPAAQPTCEARATLNNFKINLFGFVILWFEHLNFTAQRGRKPDVSVQLRQGEEAVTFGGPLEFVNGLRSLIPGGGFSEGSGIAVTPSGISAAYSLTLPAVEVGIFALANASLSASFNLPFDGTPARVNFYFSRREQPFSLTVSLLGGGGFFGIGVSAAGVNEIEAALEFGAVVAINLGVASGSVEVKAGIYFHWLEPSPGDGSVELAGYVRIHGELCVLALVSVSLTFNLQLGYLKEGGKSLVYGEAKLTVEIEILMFSTSVSVHCRREFSGAEGDPKFIEQVRDSDTWAAYCDAFAPVSL